MNVKQRDDLLQALGDCLPKLKTSAMAKALAARQEKRWTLGFAAGEPFAALAVASGEPWRAQVWDLAKGRWRKPAAGGTWTRRSFSARAFGEPALEAALGDFAALHPPCALLLETRGGRPTGRWALPLADPPAWPHFLRCDLAVRFGPLSAQLSLLVRDLAVEAVVFDGAALWAFVG